jgi:dual oxidase
LDHLIIVYIRQRIRDGDRFWYENSLTGLFNASEIAEIKATTFKDIILRNTLIPANAIQNNPFLFDINVDFCPQNAQLSPQDMESCFPLSSNNITIFY